MQPENLYNTTSQEEDKKEFPASLLSVWTPDGLETPPNASAETRLPGNCPATGVHYSIGDSGDCEKLMTRKYYKMRLPGGLASYQETVDLSRNPHSNNTLQLGRLGVLFQTSSQIHQDSDSEAKVIV